MNEREVGTPAAVEAAPCGGPQRALSSAAGGPAVAAPFPIVGLGASAGGLEALRQLLRALPVDTGMAFVVIQHLDPDRPSLLASVLGSSTAMPVVEARDGDRAEPNHVYVIPPDADLGLAGGALSLGPRLPTGRLHLPIDSFFRALAADRRDRAIAVLLSGSGADGTEGLRAVKAEGGLALVQSPDSAQFRSMPESAIRAGVVDFDGLPEDLARELDRLGRHPYIASPVAPPSTLAPADPIAIVDDEPRLESLLALLRDRTAVDLAGYRRATIRRRIARRMALRRMGTLAEYEALLREDAEEVRALARDLLRVATSFFRDPEAFDALERLVFPRLVAPPGASGSVRVWVPGCSTGPEVYGIAIRLLEFLGDRAPGYAIKIFGSDLSAEAIDEARLGVYSDAVLAAVSSDRLARFFERVDGGYRIGRRARDLCVFVRHDVARDPPFARLDLISCRNVLMYFDAELQRRVIPMFHYCLSLPGYLFLGQSEAISGFRELFSPLDERNRIFEKVGEGARLPHPLVRGRDPDLGFSQRQAELRRSVQDAQRLADDHLLTRFAPAGVLVDAALQIVQFRGRTGAFLEAPPGFPDVNVVRMARDGIAPHLYDALERAKSESTTICKSGLEIATSAGPLVLDLEVVPLTVAPATAPTFFLVLFHPGGAAQPATPAPRPGGSPTPEAEGVLRLKAELAATKEYLQSLVAEHQGTADDLAASNEELTAANEELQSTNEELQSAKEELQSTNEELGTVNDELRARNTDLDVLANDLTNVLASVAIPVIIVDLELRVRRFTPSVRDIATFVPNDVGRPIEDFKLKVRVDDLPERIREVLAGLGQREWEVEGPRGRWFRLQIRPYCTADHRLDGAVLSFVDVDALRRAITDAELARDSARRIVDTVPTALVVLDEALVVRSANRAFSEQFARPIHEVEGRGLFDLPGVFWDGAALRARLAQAATEGSELARTEVAVVLPGPGPRVLALSGRSIAWGAASRMFLLSVDDVTGLRALEQERERLLGSEQRARREAEQANRAKDLFLATLSHELRTPLGTLLLQAQLLRRVASDDGRVERASAVIERSVATQSRLIDDLLDVSRIVSGKLLLDLHVVALRGLVEGVADVLRPAAEAKSLTFEVRVDGFEGSVFGDAFRLQQVVSNLLTNAIKFTAHGGRVALRLERAGDQATITVADSGIGIASEVLPHVFSRFVQADSAVTRSHGGLGLGLAIVRHVVEVHGGVVVAESAGEGRGATFRVTLPLCAAPAAREVVTSSFPPEGVRGVRVLLVEDDDDAREAIVATLGSVGAEVRAVPSVAAALAALGESIPQVILCDVAMPGEDGYSFLRQLRQLPAERGGRVPAAAITALAADEDRRAARAAGFQLHVAKPVDADRLVATIGALLALAPGVGSP